MADFTEQGVYSCRILVPGLSEIYPVEDLEWENNSVGNLIYSAETVRQAGALLDRSERFFGLQALGVDMQGSAMHQTLLAAYDKLFAADR